MIKAFTGYFGRNSKYVTGTATTGAATVSGYLVQVTSESLTTAAGAEYTLTLTNNRIKAGSICFASAGLGTSTTGTPGIGGVTCSDGSVVITVTNLHASGAFNGTILINLIVFNGK